jgi:hypothetical protein
MHHAEPDPIAGRRLTQLLARWADAHRLTAHQTEAIRQQIVAEPAPSDFDWWWRLLDPEGGSAFRTLAAASGWETAPRAPTLPMGPAGGWQPDMPGWPAWAHEEADFQPYLRLT